MCGSISWPNRLSPLDIQVAAILNPMVRLREPTGLQSKSLDAFAVSKPSLGQIIFTGSSLPSITLYAKQQVLLHILLFMASIQGHLQIKWSPHHPMLMKIQQHYPETESMIWFNKLWRDISYTWLIKQISIEDIMISMLMIMYGLIEAYLISIKGVPHPN